MATSAQNIPLLQVIASAAPARHLPDPPSPRGTNQNPRDIAERIELTLQEREILRARYPPSNPDNELPWNERMMHQDALHRPHAYTLEYANRVRAIHNLHPLTEEDVAADVAADAATEEVSNTHARRTDPPPANTRPQPPQDRPARVHPNPTHPNGSHRTPPRHPQTRGRKQLLCPLPKFRPINTLPRKTSKREVPPTKTDVRPSDRTS